MNPCVLWGVRGLPRKHQEEMQQEQCWLMWSSLNSSANAANEGLNLRLGIWVCPEKPAVGNGVQLLPSPHFSLIQANSEE